VSDRPSTAPESRAREDELPPPSFVLARFGELVLKGRNRHAFERKLAHNVKEALRDVAPVAVEREHGQLVLRPAERPHQVARRLTEVFGLTAISPAWEAPREPDAIAELSTRLVGDALLDLPAREPVPFRVRTRRADKRFALSSVELDHHVAARVFDAHGERLRVDLDAPALTLGIAVRRERIYVYAQRLPGPGGLPSGSIGKALALVSGGIDSPVAAWLAMKRGLQVRLVSFEAEAFLGRAPAEKVRRLAGRLARWQPVTRLVHVPFADVQLAVREAVPEKYRTICYRRMMHRIATALALEEGARGLVTGDNLGQVASQTLENLGALAAATTLPVLQPLIAMDKQDTIALARRIGTYDLSIEPVPDCCTVFQPDGPTLRATPLRAEQAEAGLDVEALVREAVAGAEGERIQPTP